MLTVDGSRGEGGGQILRSALTLSALTGRPFCIERIRAGRRKPGLLRQHLTAARAVARISGAAIEGDAIGSSTLVFRPQTIRGGEHRFDVGSAGSATLVLQTVLPVLAVAPAPSVLSLGGGTHNPHAPPFEFLQLAFAPLVRRCGVGLQLTLERPGFYPAGGGLLRAAITPVESWSGLDLLERGKLVERRVIAMVARLPESIATRERDSALRALGWSARCAEVRVIKESAGPGNLLVIVLRFEQITEVVCGFGMKGVRAETVAERTARETRSYLRSKAAVGPHLADQLMLPLALAGGGRFRTLPPTSHARTNAEVIRLFLDREPVFRDLGDGTWEFSV
jgi:RNA 3'-terminal phosphate cyclase (ATP)